jgi:membrane associated rhomboid family serine protease
VIGASGAISGVFGGVLMALWQAGRMPSLLPVAAIWIALNVFFGILGGTPGSGGEPVAWIAHIGGFVYGLLALRLFVPASFVGPSQPPTDGTG